MRFPASTSLEEMKEFLVQLRKEYFADLDFGFVDALDEEGCNLILELITTKDITKRDQLRKSIDLMVVQGRKNISVILHQAQVLMLNFREKISQEQDNNDISNLESILRDI